MYAGAGLVGGVVIGAGAMYLLSSTSSYGRYSRYGRGNDRCTHDSGWSGSCSSCYQRYNNDQCIPQGPRGSANRDDLMDTGFWPADWKSPLTVTVFSVKGVDFEKSRICPPAGWSQHDGSQMPAAGSDLFMAMTEMAELGDKLEEDTGVVGPVVGTLVSICCCCCCIAAICAITYKVCRGADKVGDCPTATHDQPIVVEASLVQPWGNTQQAVVMGSPVVQQPYQPGLEPGYQPGRPVG